MNRQGHLLFFCPQLPQEDPGRKTSGGDSSNFAARSGEFLDTISSFPVEMSTAPEGP
jgi:hypothetical protein